MLNNWMGQIDWPDLFNLFYRHYRKHFLHHSITMFIDAGVHVDSQVALVHNPLTIINSFSWNAYRILQSIYVSTFTYFHKEPVHIPV